MSGLIARTPASPSGFTWWLVLAAVLVILAAAVALYRRRSRHRNRRLPVRFVPRPAAVPDLTDRADRILRETDDAVHTCEQELSLAVIRYGHPPTAAFTRALTDAQAALAAAFVLRERLPAPDEAQARAHLAELLDHCAAANTRLDEMAEEFDRLRELVTRASEAVALVIADATAAAEAVTQARTRGIALARRYSGTALDGIADHAELAQDRMRFARARIDEARTAVRAGEPCRAAARVRAAEEAVGQARRLCAAVDRREAELEEASRGLSRLLFDTDRDIAQARQFQAAGHDHVDLTEYIDQATQATQQVRISMLAEGYDPLTVSRQLIAVDEALDEALAEVRDAPLRMTWARAVLPSTLLGARSALAVAEDFVRVHRGGVGTGARACLAHASRLWEEAVAVTTGPVSALAAAKQARWRAIQAWESARRDVADFGGQAVAGPPDCVKAVLAGILIGSLWGGGYARSRGGPVVPGSFGGAATRARRGAGVGFGG